MDCDHCGEEFDSEEDLQIHLFEAHEDELNSHEKEEAKKVKREREEREKQIRERRKRYLYQGVGGMVFLAIAVVIGAQLVPSGTAKFDLEDEPMIGQENASITLVEFGDLQCPACAGFNNGPWQQIKQEYIETGKVKAYRKSFPLTTIHEWALPAEESMECVYRQDNDAFWTLKDRIYNNQNELSIGNAQDKIISWASEEGVNKSEIRSCLENGSPGKEIREDMNEGRSSGVTGTPTVYVNGKKLGDFNYQTIKEAIEKELD